MQYIETRRTFAANLEAARQTIELEASSAVPLISGSSSYHHRGYIYSVRRSAQYPRGIWQRCAVAALVVDRCEWETLISEQTLTGADGLVRTPSILPSWSEQRALVMLSANSAAGEIREYDLERRTFASDGFALPAGRGTFAWVNEDTLLAASNFGAATITSQRFPLTVRRLVRGSPAESGQEIFRGDAETDFSVSVAALPQSRSPKSFVIRVQHVGSRQDTYWVLDEQLARRRLPPRLRPVGVFSGQVLCIVEADWHHDNRIYRAGSLVGLPLSGWNSRRWSARLIIAGDDTTVVSAVDVGRSSILVQGLVSVQGRLWRATMQDGRWRVGPIRLPPMGALSMPFRRTLASDDGLIAFESFLVPPTLYRVDPTNGALRQLSRAPEAFDTADVIVEQRFARSADGTMIPYFLVGNRRLVRVANNPTILTAYGATGGGQFPRYDPHLGRLWLARGGLFVLANIRGGNEFGERWHVQGLERRHVYEDLFAVARDLINSDVTSSRRLGLLGHSSGGLLMAVAITQHPSLFGAAVIKAPLTNLLLPPGDSTINWEADHGSPSDPAVRRFLESTSPLQQLRASLGWPRPFILTATNDAAVPPIHARAFAARAEYLGLPSLFFESSNGGHGIAAEPADRALLNARIFTYFDEQLR